MNNKKTIASIAFVASSAFALIGPGPAQSKKICLDLFEDASGNAIVGTCDQNKNNEILKKTILSNGCAKDQAAMTAYKGTPNSEFNVKINACLPPNVVQL